MLENKMKISPCYSHFYYIQLQIISEYRHPQPPGSWCFSDPKMCFVFFSPCGYPIFLSINIKQTENGTIFKTTTIFTENRGVYICRVFLFPKLLPKHQLLILLWALKVFVVFLRCVSSSHCIPELTSAGGWVEQVILCDSSGRGSGDGGFDAGKYRVTAEIKQQWN